MWLSDNEHKVFSIFLSRRQTAVDMSDSYTGMQDFIKTFETGLMEYEQIFRSLRFILWIPYLIPCEEKHFYLSLWMHQQIVEEDRNL